MSNMTKLNPISGEKKYSQETDLKFELKSRYPDFRRKRPYGRVSYAYVVSEDDDFLLVPNLPFILSLEEAFDMVEGGIPLRDAASWLQEETLSPITHQTLSNLYKKHRKPHVRIKTEKRKLPKQFKLTQDQLEYRTTKAKAVKVMKKLEKMEQEKAEKKKEEVKRQTGHVPSKQDNVTYNVVFQPHAGPQTDFLSATEQEVLYGGAAGGGKSYGLLADPIRYFSHPDFRGLILRRTNDELRELKQKSKELYSKPPLNGKWSEVKSEWTFPSGATLWMTYLDRDDDLMRFQGQSYTWVGFDELTHWPTSHPWDYLRSRLRTTAKDLPVFMRGTTNPGGVGHHWVKKMFIDPAPFNSKFIPVDIETGDKMVYPEKDGKGDPHPKAGEPLFYRRFIPASLYDNPSLIEDGQYEQNLLSLSPAQRDRLLYGNWDIVDGAAFPEFNRKVHVVDRFEIPNEWRRFRACDYGYSSHSAVLWFAIDPGERLYVYRELYVSKKGPKELAQDILRIERERGEKIAYGVLDSSVWHKRGEGPTAAEIMINEGCSWRPSDRSAGSRSAGLLRLHELLKIDDVTDEPSIFFFSSCVQLLSDLPSLPAHPDGEDDIDPDYPSDHTYDALRYGIMSRPRSLSPFEEWNNGKPVRRESSFRPSNIRFGY